MKWQVDDDLDLASKTIDVTLSILLPMEGPGYLGIGWESTAMNGAHIWFCSVNEDVRQELNPFPDDCSALSYSVTGNSTVSKRPGFSCCLAPGKHHMRPECAAPGDDVYYPLEIVDWCLSSSSSSVTVRAEVCGDDTADSEAGRNCFRMTSSPGGGMDFIVAYNTLMNNRPHGYQRRTNAQVDLNAGVLTQSEAGIADDGLIATHGAFMLVGWLLLAPWGVFVRACHCY